MIVTMRNSYSVIYAFGSKKGGLQRVQANHRVGSQIVPAKLLEVHPRINIVRIVMHRHYGGTEDTTFKMRPVIVVDVGVMKRLLRDYESTIRCALDKALEDVVKDATVKIFRNDDVDKHALIQRSYSLRTICCIRQTHADRTSSSRLLLFLCGIGM
jgi:hypothetical protein